jgi:hypothetical protein
MEDKGDRTNVPVAPAFSKRRGTLKPKKGLIFALLAVVLVASGMFYWSRSCDPHAPPVVVVRACRDVTAGNHRITADFGTQFDVPEKVFSVSARTHDMAPERFYVITLRNSAANPSMLIIAHDVGVWKDLDNTPPVFSRSIKKESILGAIGRSVGMDHWGYLKNGARWR